MELEKMVLLILWYLDGNYYTKLCYTKTTCMFKAGTSVLVTHRYPCSPFYNNKMPKFKNSCLARDYTSSLFPLAQPRD